MRNAFKFILTVLFLCSITSFAQVTVYSHKNIADPCWIDPCIRLVNSSPDEINLINYTIDFYFYNTRYPLSYYNNGWSPQIWYYSGGNSASISIHSYDPPYEVGDKKANFRVRISFSGNEKIGAGEWEELEVAVVAVHPYYGYWYNQDQTNDWSYMPGQDWQINQNIVVKDLNGNIIFGNEPGNSVQKPDPIPMNWLGLIDNTTFQEIDDADLFKDGDAYKNSDDNKSYVRYKNEWQEIAGGGTTDIYDGFTMNPGNLGIDLNVGDIFNANGVGGNYADFNGKCEADYFIIDQDDPVVPTSSTDDVGANYGTFTIGQLGGQWYLFVKVEHDPNPVWKRILIPDW